MIFWDVLLHSQRHFDSFSCDSCQFPWSTPHLVKTLEKQIYIYIYIFIYLFMYLFIYLFIYIHIIYIYIFLGSLEGGASQDSLKRCKNLWKNQQKTICLDSLGGGGPSQDSLIFVCCFFVSKVFSVLVTFSHLHLFVHWPFGVFKRSSLQEPIL